MVSVSNENKNNVTVTNETKGIDQTWGEANYEWGQARGTWGTQRLPEKNESKNAVTVTNESK